MAHLLTVAEAAAVARRHPRTIRGWIRSGQLKAAAMLPGRRPLVALADLEAFMGLASTPQTDAAGEAAIAADSEILD
jgi:excisionase family DNA binding protein